MGGVCARVLAALRRLQAAETGAAAVEFALILPIMLLVYIGAIEGSALIIMDRKVQTVAGALGDLVAQANGKVSAEQMTDYFRAATAIINPYPAENLLQVVTGVTVTEDGVASVVWSKQYQNGLYGEGPHAEGDSVTLPPAMLDISYDKFVIVSEASTSYLPLFGMVIKEPIELYREGFYLPRFKGSIDEPG